MTAGRRSMLLMGLFVLLWAVVEALAAHLLRRYSPYEVVWMRYAIHLCLMLAVWGWRDFGSLWRTRRPIYQFSRSLLMLAMPACWVLSAQSGVAPATLNLIFWSAPLLILVLANLILRERASKSIWLATGAGLFGVVAMTGIGPLPTWPLLLFPIGMALSFSLYVVMTRSLRCEATRANLFYTALGVFLTLSVAIPWIWITPSIHDLIILCGVGIIGFGALLALDRMAAAAPVSFAAPVTYLQLACLAGIAMIMQQDQLGRRAIVGILLMGSVALYVWLQEPRLNVQEAV